MNQYLLIKKMNALTKKEGWMFRVLFVPFISASFLVLSGCGFSELSNRTTNPVLLDLLRDSDWLQYKYQFETISTDASRRTIFVRYRQGEKRADFVCAEPSPDALQAYASAVAAAAKGGTKGAEVAIGLNSNLSTSAAPLLYRSQGLQLLRDQMFNLCIMRMNATIDDKSYVDLLNSYILIAKELIIVEQKAIETAASRQPVVVAPILQSIPSAEQSLPSAGTEDGKKDE